MIRLLFALSLILPLAVTAADPMVFSYDSDSKLLATLSPAQMLTIQCQKGTVNFDMQTGEATYKDCTPEEGAKKLFEAFSAFIMQVRLIQVRDDKK